MRVAVFGAGAVGGLFGAYLSRAGHEVLLVARPATVAAIEADGLRVTGRLEGTFRVRAAPELPPGKAPEALLLTVKTFDLETAVAALAATVPPGTPILLLQNGLGILESVRQTLEANGWPDAERALVRAINSVPATASAPGEVRAAGEGEVVFPAPDGPAAEATRLFTALLEGAGLRVRVAADFPREVWRKVVVNAAINPVTAVHDVVNGRLLERPFSEEADQLLLEAAEVSRSFGTGITDAEARADLDRVVRATAENRSSMLQDVQRNRPTEVDAISGALLRLGRQRRLDMGFTERAIAAVRSRAAEVRTPRPEPS